MICCCRSGRNWTFALIIMMMIMMMMIAYMYCLYSSVSLILTVVNPFVNRESNPSWSHHLLLRDRSCWRPPFCLSANSLENNLLQSKKESKDESTQVVNPERPSTCRKVFGEMDSEMESSEDTHLNCFVKSSSTSSSSQLSCQSGSAFPPDALFSDSNTLPDCSATSQPISHISSLRPSG